MQSETLYLAEGAFVVLDKEKTYGLKMIWWSEDGFSLTRLSIAQVSKLDIRGSERVTISLRDYAKLFSEAGCDVNPLIEQILDNISLKLSKVTSQNAWYVQAWILQLSYDLNELEEMVFENVTELGNELRRLIDLALDADWSIGTR